MGSSRAGFLNLNTIDILGWIFPYCGGSILCIVGCLAASLVSTQVVLIEKNQPGNAGDTREASSVSRLERSPGGGQGNPLQYACLENPMDRVAWRATIHRSKELNMTEATEKSTAQHPLTYNLKFTESL